MSGSTPTISTTRTAAPTMSRRGWRSSRTGTSRPRTLAPEGRYDLREVGLRGTGGPARPRLVPWLHVPALHPRLCRVRLLHAGRLPPRRLQMELRGAGGEPAPAAAHD